MKKFAVLLNGCGVFDGSEIHEAVLTLLTLDRAGAQACCFAPNTRQAQVVDHLTGKESGEPRNCLTEAARLARGEIQPLSQLDPDAVDGLLIPGGMGAVKNLCDFVREGVHCQPDAEVKRVIEQLWQRQKPLGFLCIAPVLVPLCLPVPVKITLGHDAELAEKIGSLGAQVVECDAWDIVVDEAHKVVSTPAYMTANTIGEVALGIEKLVTQMLRWA